VIVDCAVYVNGTRQPGRLPLDQALDASRREGAFVWIGLHEPSEEEFDEVTRAFRLHELAIEDAIKAHQRPKLEVYAEDLFVVLKTARYDDATESIEFGELLLFVGSDYVVTVRHGMASALGDVRAQVDADLERIRFGPMAVLHAVIDRVVDDYVPVLEGLDNDLVEVEAEVFDPDRPRGADPTRRMYQLKREVLDFHRNTEPLLEPLGRLADGTLPGAHPELHSYFRDVEDHLTRVVTGIRYARELLTDAFDANLAQVTTRQNDDMRTISAFVAIGGVPTVIGAIYGMNFQHMPELGWRWGYALVMGVILVACLLLYRQFKRVGWL
jgi:magnesium transporter